MQIALVLFPGYTALDLIGPYQVLNGLGPSVETVFVAEHEEPVIDSGCMTVLAQKSFADVKFPDVIVVPGGLAAMTMARDGRDGPGAALIEWLTAVHRTSAWTTSVCTGALLLGAAGILNGVRATTHWYAHESLSQYGAVVVDQRVVFDGRIVTGAGVSAGIDMALLLAERLTDRVTAQGLELDLEYMPQPPFGSGHPSVAPAEVTSNLRALYDEALNA